MDEPRVSTLREFEQLQEREFQSSFLINPMEIESLPRRFPDLPIAGANNAICLGMVFRTAVSSGRLR